MLKNCRVKNYGFTKAQVLAIFLGIGATLGLIFIFTREYFREYFIESKRQVHEVPAIAITEDIKNLSIDQIIQQRLAKVDCHFHEILLEGEQKWYSPNEAVLREIKEFCYNPQQYVDRYEKQVEGVIFNNLGQKFANDFNQNIPLDYYSVDCVGERLSSNQGKVYAQCVFYLESEINLEKPKLRIEAKWSDSDETFAVIETHIFNDGNARGSAAISKDRGTSAQWYITPTVISNNTVAPRKWIENYQKDQFEQLKAQAMQYWQINARAKSQNSAERLEEIRQRLVERFYK